VSSWEDRLAAVCVVGDAAGRSAWLPKRLGEPAAQDTILALEEEVARGGTAGIDIATGDPCDPATAGIYDNYLVKRQARALYDTALAHPTPNLKVPFSTHTYAQTASVAMDMAEAPHPVRALGALRAQSAAVHACTVSPCALPVV